MTDCKLEIVDCKNLVFRTAKTSKFEGQKISVDETQIFQYQDIET